ncbi:hypothetical protein [Salinimicrobium xinjiangense]|uniref:hypothetical protein n=1 Tax=Salinimicrobium xinjiangense TaxID=438596 RepID=UPI00041AF0F0|nr:hypothetical protein [Salinimicrobium xinjiangense]
MTVEEFRDLPDHTQERILFNEARLVNFRIENGSIISLYSMYSFFMELQLDMRKDHCKKIFMGKNKSRSF